MLTQLEEVTALQLEESDGIFSRVLQSIDSVEEWMPVLQSSLGLRHHLDRQGALQPNFGIGAQV